MSVAVARPAKIQPELLDFRLNLALQLQARRATPLVEQRLVVHGVALAKRPTSESPEDGYALIVVPRLLIVEEQLGGPLLPPTSASTIKRFPFDPR